MLSTVILETSVELQKRSFGRKQGLIDKQVSMGDKSTLATTVNVQCTSAVVENNRKKWVSFLCVIVPYVL